MSGIKTITIRIILIYHVKIEQFRNCISNVTILGFFICACGGSGYGISMKLTGRTNRTLLFVYDYLMIMIMSGFSEGV